MTDLKILFIGDVVAKIGRKAVKKVLPEIKEKFKIDYVIANGENLAHGRGLTENTLREILTAGVDFLTSGNHVFDRKEIIPKMDKIPVLRPANYPEGVPGRGYEIVKIGKTKFAIVNLLGRIFTKTKVDCPFRKADEILAELEKQKVKHILIDIHAEATAEKIAFFRYLDGKVSAILGTHTHIQTADEEVSEKGTAYISDVGGVYVKDTVIGVEKAEVIETFRTALPAAHQYPEQGKAVFNAVVLRIDAKTGKTKSIERIYKIV